MVNEERTHKIMGSLREPLQHDDVAVCLCHGVPATLEVDSDPPFWSCQIDDVVCEVSFEKVRVES